MPTYHINSAEQRKTFTGKSGGEFAVWALRLTGEDKTVELVQRVDAPDPTGNIEGTVEPNGDYPPKFKKVQAAFGGGGYKGKTPEESNRIARMNSHTHALKYWELKYAGNPEFGFASWGDYLKIVDLFYLDVKGAS